MKFKKISRFAALMISACAAVNTVTVSAQGNTGPPQNDSCKVNIPFSVYARSKSIPEGTVFTVKIEAVGDAPMPEKTEYDVEVFGDYEFGPITFDEPDDYEYIISETAYDDDRIIFDERIYHVYAAVLYDDSGELSCGISLTREDSGEKANEVEFVNGYVETDGGDDSGGKKKDDSGGDRSDGSGTGGGSSGGSSSVTGGTDSSKGSSWGDVLSPNTGAALTLGLSGSAVIGLFLMLTFRNREDKDDEPDDKETG